MSQLLQDSLFSFMTDQLASHRLSGAGKNQIIRAQIVNLEIMPIDKTVFWGTLRSIYKSKSFDNFLHFYVIFGFLSVFTIPLLLPTLDLIYPFGYSITVPEGFTFAMVIFMGGLICIFFIPLIPAYLTARIKILPEQYIEGSPNLPTSGPNYNYYQIEDLDLLDGIEFENFLGVLFKKMGYSVITTPQGPDQGADLIIEDQGLKIVVQAKKSRFKN